MPQTSQSPTARPRPEDFGLTPERIARAKEKELLIKQGEIALEASRRSSNEGCLEPIAGLIGIGSLIYGVGALFSGNDHVFFWCVMGIGFWLWHEYFVKEPKPAVRAAAAPPAPDPDITTLRAFEVAEAEWVFSQKHTWAAKGGHEFERDFGALLNARGWKVSVTKASGDGGVDIEGLDPARVRCLLQCKWWEQRCGVQPIRELAGVLAVTSRDVKGIVVCKGGFTSAAKTFARQANISLWGIAEVMNLVRSEKI